MTSTRYFRYQDSRRAVPAPLWDRYNLVCDYPSDINEHLPTLYKFGLLCEHVTEMGTRNADGSTVAFLAAQPKEFIAWDLNPRSIISQSVADLVTEAEGSRCSFQPRVGNSLKVNIEQTDLLFIDTFHTGQQLYSELVRHWQNVQKYIIMHDTTTFGLDGEDGSAPGLRLAIRNFQKEEAFPLWKLAYESKENNGLVVLAHVRVPDEEYAHLDNIDHSEEG